MSYILAHTKLWWCWWDIPAVILLVGVIVYYVLRVRKMKKTQEDLEDRLSKLYADDTVKEDIAS